MMRAKLKVESVLATESGDKVTMRPVTTGSAEDNSYSKYTPSGLLELSITNPDLLGKIKPGEVFYVDFTKTDA